MPNTRTANTETASTPAPPGETAAANLLAFAPILEPLTEIGVGVRFDRQHSLTDSSDKIFDRFVRVDQSRVDEFLIFKH